MPRNGHARCFSSRDAMIRPYPHERRSDRRLHLTGQAVLRPIGRRGSAVFGGIVDVSASGVRLRVRPGADLESGDLVSVDMEVPLPMSRETAPPVRLRGKGSVLRVDLDAEGATEAAIRFGTPLVVSDAFTAAVPPLAAPIAR